MTYYCIFPPVGGGEISSDLLTVSSEISRVPITSLYFTYLLNKTING